MSALAIKGGKPLVGDKMVGKKWPIADDTDRQALNRVLESDTWCSGMHEKQTDAEVGKFEIAFAEYQGSKYGCAVTNGTTALDVSLRAGGINSGDEVIVPAASFVATAIAVTLNDAIPVFVDVDLETNGLLPEAVENAITEKTRAIIPVHSCGYPADMKALGKLAKKHNLFIVEDCAHVHGTIWDGHKFPVSDFGAFSFQEGKLMTAGEGGMVLTDNYDHADRIHAMCTHGRVHGHPFGDYHELGTNFRMTEFQGALLLAQLARLEDQNKHRDANATYLTKHLENLPGLRAIKRDSRLTLWGFYHWNFKFVPDLWEGITRDQFVEAAMAEGLPIGPGMQVAPMFECPLYAENKAPSRIQDCPNCYVWKEEALNFSHRVFLGPQEDMDLIYATFLKIWDNRDELRV